MIRCILFDRDGTLGELLDKRYPATLVPYADIAATFSEIKKRGLFVGVITNQSSIARGTGKNYDFDKEFSAYGADVWEICPHDDADGCNCRKPQNGLLLAAAKRLAIDPCECLVVGDRVSDVQCAISAGAKAALVLTGNGKDEQRTALCLCPELLVLPRFDDILKYL